MANSLQDQLIKAGLASEKPRPKASKPKRVASRGKAPRSQQAATEIDLGKAYALRARAEREEREEKARQAKELAERRKRIKKEISAILDGARLNDDSAETDYYFEHRRRIRRMYVTEEQQQAVSEGTQAIVWFARRYHLVNREIAERIAQVDAEAIVVMLQKTGAEHA